MANPPTKTPSILLEAIKFAASVPAETPYEDLTKVALEAGWAWYLRQIGTEQTPRSFVVHFDLQLSKDGEAFQSVNTISVQTDGGLVQITDTAHQAAQAAVAHMFFGRLPPVKEVERAPVDRAKAAEQLAAYTRGYEEYDEPVGSREEDAANRAHNEPAIAVVGRRTPDGLPIFVDLFGPLGRGPDIAAEVLNVIEDALPLITTVPQLMALMSNNPDLIPFFQDLADVTQRQELKAMLDRRKMEIEAAPAPRRRQVA